MICGLFSTFDPTTLTFGFPKWSLFLLLLLVGWGIFVLYTGLSLITKELMALLTKGFSQSQFPKMTFLPLVTIFFLFFLSNLAGLFPFFFSLSSHLVYNLSVSLPFWLAGLILSISNSLTLTLAHLTPLGSPVFLWPLLVCVESVSLMIRPITLSIRLMANVMAGHLILSLVMTGFSSSFFLLPAGLLVSMGLLFFEVCVSAVQSYVFMSLMSLYWDEASTS